MGGGDLEAGSQVVPVSHDSAEAINGQIRSSANKHLYSLEGLDSDGQLWHNREATSKVVRRHTENAKIAMEEKGGGQGMVFGVVFPTTANILGVLLFLRLPWIVGKAGVLQAFGLVGVCCSCTFITTLSLSAVATNGKIMGGGSYFLISRSLGPALGAGVGLCFYMANSIGAAMYFMGTVEAWEIAFPDAQILEAGTVNNVRVTSFLILAVALVVVSLGIKFVTRAGTGFLMIVFLTILCMFLGCLIGPVDGVGTGSTYVIDVQIGDVTEAIDVTWAGVAGGYITDNFGPGYDEEQLAFPTDTTEYSFIALMALWFPACTGIMAGSNRSADLNDPAGTIPIGTLIAQGATSICYLCFVLLYGAAAPRVTLLNDKFFAASSAFPLKLIVIFGVMASTIGAGLTSLLSGSRLLSAIAGDGTLPILQFFAASPGKEPRLALVASGVLCVLALAVGELNAVAPILTMFFLMCYTCVNASCAILVLVNDPNWRPTFKYHHWAISVVGAVLCVWMMFAISPMFALLAIVFCFLIFVYAAHNSHSVKWGDGFQGMKFQLARNVLMKMDLTQHTKNWRPQLLIVTGASMSEDSSLNIDDPEIVSFASQLKGGHGITIIGGVCSSQSSDFFSDGGPFMFIDGQNEMKKVMQENSIAGFGRIVYTDDFSDGLMSLVQMSGLGAFQPNCVLAQWPQGWDTPGQQGQDQRARFLRLVQVAVVFQKVVMIAKGSSFPALSDRLTGNVDIWWIVADGGILLLLPFLLKKHKVWSHCRTRLFAVAEEVCDDPAVVQRELETYVRDYRLNIEVHVKVVKGTEEERQPAAGYLADAAAALRESGDAMAQLNSDSVRSSGSVRAANSDTLNSKSSFTRLMRQMGPQQVGFPSTPPSTIGSNAGLAFRAALHGTPAVGEVPQERRSAAQLVSNTPCNLKDLAAARGLNVLLQESSSEADLVVTNLPDMPMGESALGYCQLVHAMTSGLRRCLLVRGTATEVITAFT